MKHRHCASTPHGWYTSQLGGPSTLRPWQEILYNRSDTRGSLRSSSLRTVSIICQTLAGLFNCPSTRSKRKPTNGLPWRFQSLEFVSESTAAIATPSADFVLRRSSSVALTHLTVGVSESSADCLDLNFSWCWASRSRDDILSAPSLSCSLT